MSARGFFISIEGGEGGGKSSQIAELQLALVAAGHDVVRTFEPGATPLGVEIRMMLLNSDHEIDPRTQALLFAADRAQHVATVVQPALDRGAIVLTDRYVDSSLAYQGTGNGDGIEVIRPLSTYAARGLMPDMTLLLDLDPEVGLRRAANLGQADKIESLALDFHHRLRAGFLSLADAEPDRFTIIDAGRSFDEVRADVAKSVFERLTRSD